MFEANLLFGSPNGYARIRPAGRQVFCELEYSNPCIDFKCGKTDYRGRIGCSDLAGFQKLIPANRLFLTLSRSLPVHASGRSRDGNVFHR
jgi:hypothetical protein